MRPYATVSPLFWTGATGKRLRATPDAQRVAFYLMTSPHAHQSGVYYLPLMYLCHEVGISQEGASKALAHLSGEGFCVYDESSEWVWVCEMAAWQIGSGLSQNDKRCKGIQHYLGTLPDLAFTSRFIERYKSEFHLSPMEGASKEEKGASSDQNRSEQEQNKNRQDGADAPTPAKLPKRPSRRCPPDFAISDEMRVWASTECPGVDVSQQTKAFRDYEFRNSHSDWPATWRTWMRKAQENLRGKQPQQPVNRSREFPG